MESELWVQIPAPLVNTHVLYEPQPLIWGGGIPYSLISTFCLTPCLFPSPHMLSDEELLFIELLRVSCSHWTQMTEGEATVP